MGLIRFTLPDLGEGLEEAEIVAWHVAVGDRVVADQPLVSVETDKAVVEIPAPWSGTLVEILAEPGAMVRVGAPLAAFETAARPDAGAVVGDLGSARVVAEQPAPATSGAVRAAPMARALAARHGIDLASVTGSGPGGAITRADVEARIAAAPAEGAWEPLGAARRAMARQMVTAAAVVPATVQDVADVSAWMSPAADVLLRLIRAIVRGIGDEPGINAWFDPERAARRIHDRLDLGLAVEAAEGLYVPVLRDAARLGAADLRAEAARLITAARERRLTPEDSRDATFTLSNFGTLGGRHAALVVVPPQVAILGAGRVFADVGWGNGGAERRMRLPLSLSFDHRALTGGDAARFLTAAIRDLERDA
jgi:pyruvate dehydrogenase E2 component (dihydrolipoamide acetyltransferase)